MLNHSPNTLHLEKQQHSLAYLTTLPHCNSGSETITSESTTVIWRYRLQRWSYVKKSTMFLAPSIMIQPRSEDLYSFQPKDGDPRKHKSTPQPKLWTLQNCCGWSERDVNNTHQEELQNNWPWRDWDPLPSTSQGWSYLKFKEGQCE